MMHLKSDAEDAPCPFLVRKTGYLFIVIVMVGLGAIALLLLVFGAAANRSVRTQETGAGQMLLGLFLIVFLLVWTVLRRFLLDWLVRYFYTLIVVTTSRVLILKYSLNFMEDLQVAELYRVLAIHTKQEGILASLLNFGTISLQLQNDAVLSVRAVAHPKTVVQKMEALKEYSLEQRLQGGTDEGELLGVEEDAEGEDAASSAKEHNKPGEEHQHDESVRKDALSFEIDKKIKQEVKKRVHEELHKELSDDT